MVQGYISEIMHWMTGMNLHLAYVRVVGAQHILWSSVIPGRYFGRGSILIASSQTLDMYGSTRLILELLAIRFRTEERTPTLETASEEVFISFRDTMLG